MLDLIVFQVPKPTDPNLSAKEAERIQREEQRKIDTVDPLTEDDYKEREELMNNEGFAEWNKRDFIHFVKANEKYGRHDIESIAAECEKSKEEAWFLYHMQKNE